MWQSLWKDKLQRWSTKRQQLDWIHHCRSQFDLGSTCRSLNGFSTVTLHELILTLRATALRLCSRHSYCFLIAPRIYFSFCKRRKKKKKLIWGLKLKRMCGLQTAVSGRAVFYSFWWHHSALLVVLLLGFGRVAHVHKYWLKLAPKEKIHESEKWVEIQFCRRDELDILFPVFEGGRNVCFWLHNSPQRLQKSPLS